MKISRYHLKLVALGAGIVMLAVSGSGLVQNLGDLLLRLSSIL